jgi:branched-subunit amino acid transport protein
MGDAIMTDGQIWAVLVGLGLCSMLSRSAALLLPASVRLPDWLVIGLRYAPMAALAAVITPQFLAPSGALALGLDNPRWIAGLAGILVWWIWRDLLAVLAVGTVAFFGVGWWLA